MKLMTLIGDVIRSLERGAAGVVVVHFPGDKRTVVANARIDFNDSRRTEVGPGELLFARPHQLHWLACRLGQASRFDCRLGRMFATIAGSHVGSDEPDLLWLQVEGSRQLRANTEGHLRAGPDG